MQLNVADLNTYEVGLIYIKGPLRVLPSYVSRMLAHGRYPSLTRCREAGSWDF